LPARLRVAALGADGAEVIPALRRPRLILTEPCLRIGQLVLDRGSGGRGGVDETCVERTA
jgi:hypothetical protein